MVLHFERPTERLATELSEVQAAAAELANYLSRQANVPIFKEFPKKVLIDLTSALSEVPNATAQGARQTLLFAQEKLASIRSEHIPRQNDPALSQDPEIAPRLIRGELLDDRLTALLSAVSTALQAANREIADAHEVDRQPNPSIEATRGEAHRKIARQTLGAQRQFLNRRSELDQISMEDSVNADRLRRRLTDVVVLTQAVRTELAMPRIVPAWLKHLGEAIRDYPGLIIKAATAMRTAVDVADWAHDKWDKYNAKLFKASTATLREVADDIVGFGQDLAKRRRDGRRTPTQGDYDSALVHKLLLAGDKVPDAWLPKIQSLNFEYQPLTDIGQFATFKNLEQLKLASTKVEDLGPLMGLQKLTHLELSRSGVVNINPVAFLPNLVRLDIDGLPIEDISALSNLEYLVRLDLSRTRVTELDPISELYNLVHLELAKTRVYNLRPLSGLVRLRWLDVSGTEVNDLLPLSRCSELEHLDVLGSQVKSVDLDCISHLLGKLELII